MTPRELREHKKTPKTLQDTPVFQPLKRGKLPKPFHTFGGPRVFATPLMDVSFDHSILIMYRDGALLADSAFYAYFMVKTGKGYYPLLHFHWHPSHKGFHCKIPCSAKIDYDNRLLPGAPELALKTRPHLDPRNSDDRLRLAHAFCEICGITFGDRAALWESQ